jgi:hypothetical protein
VVGGTLLYAWWIRDELTKTITVKEIDKLINRSIYICAALIPLSLWYTWILW